MGTDMKQISTLLITFVGSLAITLSVQAAQTVTKDVGSFGSWKTAQISGHDLWNKDACVSSTPAREDASTLELYAEKLTGNTAYVEPSVQVVTRGATGYVRAVLTNDDDSTKVQLTLASTTATPAAFGVLSRLDDRTALIATLKKANNVQVQLINEKNSVVKTLNFSLKGSSKAIDAANTGCGLAL